MDENQKFHGRISKISSVKIKNFMNENQKFHGRISKISLIKIKKFHL